MRTRTHDGTPIRRAPVALKPILREGQAIYCVLLLKQALACARAAGAPYTVKRIEAALSSARGAVRNAGYRVTREGR